MLLCLTLALSADSQVENVETMGVSVLIVLKCPKFKVNVMCREPSVEENYRFVILIPFVIS